jgi:hypothetical protein
MTVAGYDAIQGWCECPVKVAELPAGGDHETDQLRVSADVGERESGRSR